MIDQKNLKMNVLKSTAKNRFNILTNKWKKNIYDSV